jgi:hypothetical protein
MSRSNNNVSMISLKTGLFLLIMAAGMACSSQKSVSSMRSDPNSEQGILKLSSDKWQWMADKNVDSLASLFHDESKYERNLEKD